MKPTTDLIKSALKCAEKLAVKSHEAGSDLYAAKILFESDCSQASLKALERARNNLKNLRRSQTAAIEAIDEAIRLAADEGPRGLQHL